MQSMYTKREMEKKHCYEQRVLEVEHASFTPLVMSGWDGKYGYIRLALMLGKKERHSLQQDGPMGKVQT